MALGKKEKPSWGGGADDGAEENFQNLMVWALLLHTQAWTTLPELGTSFHSGEKEHLHMFMMRGPCWSTGALERFWVSQDSCTFWKSLRPFCEVKGPG